MTTDKTGEVVIMPELKPVAWHMTQNSNAVFLDDEHEVAVMMEHGWQCKPVYALPDTHRIVPVQLLQTLVGVSYYKDEFMEACEEAQAIIDKEQGK
jgi:hypothetical protein